MSAIASIRASRPARSAALAAALLLAASPALADDPSASGTVLDSRTGEAIVGAWVFEAVPGERRGSDVRRFERVRETRTDERGRFHFAPETRGWVARLFSHATPPRYHVYHERYGLVWGREGAGRIELSLRDAHLRSADASQLCGTQESDALHARVRARHCPPAQPDRFADGRPRATGAVDDRGRRSGPWRFFREDGSLLAEGQYVAGAASGRWVFHPRPGTEGN